MVQYYSILVKPNKKANKAYWHEGTLFDSTEKIIVVETKEPPIEGRANKQVVKLVADFLAVSPSCVSIKNGLKSKYKTVVVTD